LRRNLLENTDASLRQVLPFGVPAIDNRLPDGGLAVGALHEVAGGADGGLHGAAAARFAAAILARSEGPVLWCLRQRDLLAPALGLIATALIVALLVILMRRIADPLESLASAMSALSSGALDTPVSALDRHDEIGAMARSVQVFKENAVRLAEAEKEGARLLEARVAAEAASSAKGEFLAHMSHELRTPLNGVLTMAQLMAKDELNQAQRAKLDVILLTGQDLLHVINDVLDFSKIEAGMLELDTVVFDPRQVLNGILHSFEPVAQRKGVYLRLHMSGLGDLRRGDPARLRQIVGNYVANALKFTIEGGVDIKASSCEADGQEGLYICVRDTGIGIEQENMSRLFQRFSQVDASTTRKFGGTGLGLAICRELATHMGGAAWARSAPGTGSSFHVTLPLPQAHEEATKDETSLVARTGTSLRILAAEDNLTNQAVLKAIMSAVGMELTLASTGVEAVELWRKERFDLILMDVHMPDMNGLEATRQIRAGETRAGRSPIPIIALTANAYAHQVAEYVAAGMDDHVSKPIDIQALVRTIQRLLPQQQNDQQVSTPTSPLAIKPRRSKL
jgi:signal transduction histidine kinase/CheY-like chemotaxis protein